MNSGRTWAVAVDRLCQKCSVHFVSLSCEAEVLQHLDWPTLDSQTSSRGLIWHRIDIYASAVVCLEAVTLTGDWHTLEVSRLNGISLDNIWPSYFLYFEVIVCASIWIILFLTIVYYIKVRKLSTTYTNSNTVECDHILDTNLLKWNWKLHYCLHISLNFLTFSAYFYDVCLQSYYLYLSVITKTTNKYIY